MILGPNFDKRLEAFVAQLAQLVALQIRQAEALERMAAAGERNVALMEQLLEDARAVRAAP